MQLMPRIVFVHGPGLQSYVSVDLGWFYAELHLTHQHAQLSCTFRGGQYPEILHILASKIDCDRGLPESFLLCTMCWHSEPVDAMHYQQGCTVPPFQLQLK